MFPIIFLYALQNILLGTGVEASVPAYSHLLGTQLVHLIAGAYGQENEQRSCTKKFAEHRFGSPSAARFLAKHHVDVNHHVGGCDGYGNHCSMYVIEVPISRRTAVPQLIFVFEGTTHFAQLLAQAWEVLKSMDDFTIGDHTFGKVNRYFLRVFNNLWTFVIGYIQAYTAHELWFLGHSLGGASAALAGFVTRVYGLRSADMVKVITLGQPRVGNPQFATTYDSLVPNTDRVVNGLDIVSHLYPCEKSSRTRPLRNGATACSQSKTNAYYHHGREKWYDRGTGRSGFKDCTGKPKNEDMACSNSHNFRGFGLILQSGSHFATHRTYFGHWLWYYGVAGCDDNLEQEKIAGESPDEALAYNNPEDAMPWQ